MDKLLDILMGFTGIGPYILVFLILLACGLGVPIPEDITLFCAGVLAYYGNANVYLMIVVSFWGVMIGDSIIFLLGAKYGRMLTRRWFFAKFLPEERLEVGRKKFKKWGNKLIFAARFMPGLRAPVFFTAGTLHVPFRVFFFYDGLAAMLSVPTIVYLVYHFGDELEMIVKKIKKVQTGVLLVIFGIIVILAIHWYIGYRRSKSRPT